jgi:hypothetical protein
VTLEQIQQAIDAHVAAGLLELAGTTPDGKHLYRVPGVFDD